jgi:hypothetical protein
MSAVPYSSRTPFGRRFGGGQDVPPGAVTLRRGALIGIGIVGLALAAWAGVATWCLLQTDVLSESFFARQTAAERAYEERIGALRTRLDRVTSQKLVEQQGFDARLAEIAERQREIEGRHAALSRLVDQTGVSPARRDPKPHQVSDPAEAPPRARPLAAGTKPAPVADSFELRIGAWDRAPNPESPPRRLKRSRATTA